MVRVNLTLTLYWSKDMNNIPNVRAPVPTLDPAHQKVLG